MLLAFHVVLATGSACAAGNSPERVSVKPGSTTVIATVTCAKDVTPPEFAKVITWTNMSAIVVTSPPAQHDDLLVTAKVGGKLDAGATTCEGATVDQTYLVSFDAAPEVSGQALQTSFQVLVAALVVALLLKSAFALLFNWRPFNILFVGKAWRSPIMLAAAWQVVANFKFDLMAQLFSAYYPRLRIRRAFVERHF